MDRSNHYERAFAAYLRQHGCATVAIDESRRSLYEDEPLKSADFITVGPGESRLVIDVKGRRFPGGTSEKPRAVWQSWSTLSDISGLQKWAEGFGSTFRGVLAFVYEIKAPFEIDGSAPDRFHFENRNYLMRGIDALAYAATMVTRSRRWGTVHLPAPAFRALCRPFSFFLNGTLTV
jgi:hypothetical protein